MLLWEGHDRDSRKYYLNDHHTDQEVQGPYGLQKGIVVHTLTHVRMYFILGSFDAIIMYNKNKVTHNKYVIIQKNCNYINFNSYSKIIQK